LSAIFALVALACFVFTPDALAQNTIANISATKHNLSTGGPGTVKATTENQICVFCHTPHGAEQNIAPLWNRALSSETYSPYTSSSLDSEDILGELIGQPGGASKLCLSCHDGTLAIGSVTNSPGSGTGSAISISGAGAGGAMPAGSGATTGFTRNLGTNLTNDHPISLIFDGSIEFSLNVVYVKRRRTLCRGSAGVEVRVRAAPGTSDAVCRDRLISLGRANRSFAS
jgi:hypothetical protein